MKRVAIDELVLGMVLAKPVTNVAGLPVVPEGVEVTSSMITRLQQLGVTSVYVEGDAGDDKGKTLAELDAELEHRFRKVLQDPLQAMIHRHIRDHIHATHGIPTQEGSAGV